MSSFTTPSATLMFIDAYPQAQRGTRQEKRHFQKLFYSLGTAIQNEPFGRLFKFPSKEFYNDNMQLQIAIKQTLLEIKTNESFSKYAPKVCNWLFLF